MQAHDNLYLSDLFSDVIISDVIIDQEYNEHAKINIKGHVPEDVYDSYILQRLENQVIHLHQKPSEDESSAQTIFCGIVIRAKIHHKGKFYTIDLEGISFSYLLDVASSCKSYQDIHMSFDDVINDQISSFDAQYINEDPKKDEEISKFILKYNESTWEFTRRLVSRNFIGLVPDIISEKIAFWVDLPQGRKAKDVTAGEFDSFRIIAHGDALTKNTWVSDADTNDFFGYEFLKRIEKYDIGDTINFEGLKLRIIKIHSYLDKSIAVMRHDITALVENGCKQAKYYNGSIQGLSLEGSVIDRRKDFTKVHLFSIDEKQDVDTASWFRQPTFYTAGKDRGWCAMPELGDQLSLHFPNVEENDCYLLDSTQVPYSQTNANVSSSSNSAKQKSGKKSDREIPASKFINAPNGQVMLLEDDLILFHSKDNFSSLALHEEHVDEKGKTLGITMRTKGDINFEGENINIGIIEDVSKKVIIESDETIELVCSMSSLIVDAKDGAHFKAPKVKLYPEIEFEEEIGSFIMAENVDESTKTKSGNGKDGKLTIDEVMNEFAKAAGFKNIEDVKKLKAKNTQYGDRKKSWEYVLGGKTYGGPVDCSGIFYAIADKYNQEYKYRTASSMASEFKVKTLPKKNGKIDTSAIPEGTFLYRPKKGNRPAHVALYVGEGRIINASDPTYDTCTRANNIDTYDSYGYLPFVDYEEKEKSQKTSQGTSKAK